MFMFLSGFSWEILDQLIPQYVDFSILLHLLKDQMVLFGAPFHYRKNIIFFISADIPFRNFLQYK